MMWKWRRRWGRLGSSSLIWVCDVKVSCRSEALCEYESSELNLSDKVTGLRYFSCLWLQTPKYMHSKTEENYGFITRSSLNCDIFYGQRNQQQSAVYMVTFRPLLPAQSDFENEIVLKFEDRFTECETWACYNLRRKRKRSVFVFMCSVFQLFSQSLYCGSTYSSFLSQTVQKILLCYQALLMKLFLFLFCFFFKTNKKLSLASFSLRN